MSSEDARPKVFVGTNVPRVFLGGLPPNITESELRLIFQEFGRVIDVVIVIKDDRRLTGIAFVSFEEQTVADTLIGRRFLRINGKEVEIQRARPRNSDSELLLPFSTFSADTSPADSIGGPDQDLISFTGSDNDDDSSSDDGSVITVVKKL